MRWLALMMCSLAVLPAVRAQVQEQAVTYRHGETVCEGYAVWKTPADGRKLRAVLIVHQWMGISEHEKTRARILAEMGYYAFCVDMYGQAARPADRQQAREQTTIYRADRGLMRARAAAALAHVQALPEVDADRVAAIGYCFGGGVALELARSGAPLKAAVSFHGNLDTPQPEATKDLKAALLVCHGAADTAVPMSQVEAFVKEMEAAKADYVVNIYANAVHGFTHLNDPERYDRKADQRSWAAMSALFAEALR